jgi:uncharacterized membrane protein (TIGR02234 family)
MPDQTPGSASAGPYARGYGQALVLGLVSAAAATAGAARPWQSATASVAGLPTISAQVDGSDLVPLAGALGVVLLAAFGAVVATRGWVRRGLGVLIVVCAVAVLVMVIHPGGGSHAIEQQLSAKGWSGGSYSSGTAPWRWVSGAGAVGSLVAGALIARFGGQWAIMSSRYDAPLAAEQERRAVPVNPTEADLWRSIDSGHDPTQAP